MMSDVNITTENASHSGITDLVGDLKSVVGHDLVAALAKAQTGLSVYGVHS
jgi:hypothetical protein